MINARCFSVLRRHIEILKAPQNVPWEKNRMIYLWKSLWNKSQHARAQSPPRRKKRNRGGSAVGLPTGGPEIMA